MSCYFGVEVLPVTYWSDKCIVVNVTDVLNVYWETSCNLSVLSWHFVSFYPMIKKYFMWGPCQNPCLSPLGIPGCGGHCASLFLAGDVATGLHHPCMCSLSCDSNFTIVASLIRSRSKRQNLQKSLCRNKLLITHHSLSQNGYLLTGRLPPLSTAVVVKAVLQWSAHPHWACLYIYNRTNGSPWSEEHAFTLCNCGIKCWCRYVTENGHSLKLSGIFADIGLVFGSQ